MKLTAPDNMASIVIEGKEYHVSDGAVDIDNPAHVGPAMSLGATDWVDEPKRAEPVVASGASDTSELVNKLSIADARVHALELENTRLNGIIDDLEKKLADAHKGQHPSSDTSGVSTLTGDTSSTVAGGTKTTTTVPQGQSGDHADTEAAKLRKAIETHPDFETATRDELVGWLHSVKVAVSGNVSRDKAKEIAEKTVKDYNEGLADAAQERADNKDTSTSADTMVN